MNTPEQVVSVGSDLAKGLKANARWAIISGIVMLVAGMLAITSPFVAGISITIMVGVILVVSGISQCFLAFKAGAFGRGLVLFIVGVLMTIAGFYMMSQPVAGLATLTIILMTYLLVTGVLEIIVAFQLKPSDGWGLELFSGIVTLLLGIMLWRQFPFSGAWAIGILFGVKLIISGWTFIFIGRSVKKTAAESQVA